MDTIGVALGVISLVIAIMAEVRSARVKQILEVKFSEIKASNQLIINSARSENNSSSERIQFILGAAESQKTLINGLGKILKFRYLKLWDKSSNAQE
jgi:hypothetical protein